MWEAIQRNKRKSVLLIIVMGFILIALGASIGGAFLGQQEGVLGGIFIAGIVWFFLTVIAMTQGRNILLAVSGAREISHDDAPQLYNIVEEMRIAAALPATPKVYIMETKAPNAFAVGNPEHAAVAVTTGLLSVLSRDELQGVIAHEIGHIKNQDTKFMTIAGVMLGTIVILADVFTRSMFYGSIGGGRRSSSSSRDGGNQLQMIFFIVAIVLAILAPILAQIFYFACSRSREYLADASAALFTRFPEGLASALEKISSSSEKMADVNRITAPMYIINPMMAAKGSDAVSIFSTHPATGERVKILRSMAGGAGLGDYNRAFEKTTGHEIIGANSLRSAEELEMRGIKSQEQPVNTKKQTREAIDILHRLNNFIFITCPCGLRLKIPPSFGEPTVKCPKCGAVHQIVK